MRKEKRKESVRLQRSLKRDWRHKENSGETGDQFREEGMSGQKKERRE